MRALENLRLSMRYVRMRLLESALAVIGTTLGVALIAAAATLIQTYNAGVARDLSSPTYRFVDIQPSDLREGGDVPIARLGSGAERAPDLQLSDIDTIRAEVPAADYVFAYSRELAGGGGGQVFAIATSKAVGPGPAKGGGAAVGGGAAGSDAPVTLPEDKGVSVDNFAFTAPPGNAGAVTFEAAPPVVDQPAMTETLTPLVDEYDLVRLTEDGFKAWGATLKAGSFFTTQDQQKGTPLLVLGASLARKMFEDTDPVGGRFRKDGAVWTVVGVLNPIPYVGPDKGDVNQWAFAPFQRPAVRLPGGQVLSLPDRVRTISVGVKDTTHLRDALAQVNAWITRHFGADSPYAAQANLLEAEQSRANHNRLFVVIGFLAGAALLISSITLLNLMTTRTLRRARSIGIFRSLGARRTDVFSLFLGESLFITLLGGLIGFILAPLLYQLFLASLIPASWNVEVSHAFNWLVMVIALLGAVALNLLFGVFPALQAARTDVVTSIRAD